MQVLLEQEACLFTQVLEPEAMTVVAVGGASSEESCEAVSADARAAQAACTGRRYVVSVVGRGTEVIQYESKGIPLELRG